MKNKYFNSESIVLWRSEIKPSDYNPRKISDEGRRALKKSIKTYGIVGGIIINSQTGNTIVGGHQKVDILDELNKYNPKTRENDYQLKVEIIDVDEKTEKELNITLNNPNVGGDWDYDKMRELIPDIDYKNAGLTDEDLSLIGIDFTLQTEEESFLADALEELSEPIEQQREERKQAVKEMKAQIRDKAEEKVKEMESYVMVNFQNFDSKAEFMERFGYHPQDKFIQGEYLVKLIEQLS